MAAASITSITELAPVGGLIVEVRNRAKLAYGLALLRSFTVVLSGDYATNGITFDLSAYFKGILRCRGFSAGYGYSHDGGTPAAGKLKLWFCDYSAGTDGALIEVNNGTTLAETTLEVDVIGWQTP